MCTRPHSRISLAALLIEGRRDALKNRSCRASDAARQTQAVQVAAPNRERCRMRVIHRRGNRQHLAKGHPVYLTTSH